MKRASIFTVCAFSLLPGNLPAQTVTGTILGIVSDASGGAVPQARVSISNERTGQVRELLTDPQGAYLANFLPAGTYTVAVEKPEFRKAAFTGVLLQVDQQVRLNLTVEVGAVTQEVTVVGAAPLLQTENASMGDVVDTKKVLTLPLNGRDFLQLAQLSPGVTTGGVGGEGLAVNGGRGDYNGYLMDGVTNFNRFSGGVVIRPNVDAVQEFKVQTATYSAEFGFAGNGQINLITKTGTNQFHGTAYEFLRNSTLDARNFFAPPGPKIPFKRNQFGGTVGGPVRKNKTFFFSDYEGLRIRQAATIRSLIPTAELKSGNFEGERPIFDPLTYSPQSQTVQQFPNNRIPAERISKVAAGLNSYYPEPNVADPRLNHINTAGRSTTDNGFGVRFDHQLLSNNQLFARYGLTNTESFNPGALPVLGTFNAGRAQLLSINDTHLVTSSIINELRLGFNRNRNSLTTPRTGTEDIANQLGVGGASTDPLDFGFPGISIQPNYASVSDPTNPFPTFRWENVYMLGNTLSVIRGTHALKFGAQVHRMEMNGVQNSHGRGTFDFDGRFTRNPQNAANTGHEFADYLLGYASRTQRQVGSTRVDMRSTYAGAFFQDDWKVTPRLTLNLGVRYEVNTPLADKYGRNSNVDWVYGVDRAAIVQAGDIGPVSGNKYNTATYEQDSNNWAPRVGFAYRPFGQTSTVVRGGYGIFYALARGQLFSFNAQNPPRIVNETFTAQFPNPELTFANGFLLGALQPAAILSARGIQRDRRDAYIQQWDFTGQRQLSGDLMLEAAYVGTKGTKLARSGLPNIPRPGPGPIQPRRPIQGFSTLFVREARMSSIYHALQLKADKRFRGGLTFLTAYTFGKSIDDGSASFGGGGNSSDNAQDPENIRAERGRSAHDARQRFVASYIYELPFGKGKPFAGGASGALDAIIGGWQLAGITTFQTGLSNTVRTQTDVCNCDRAGGRMRGDATGIPWKLDDPTPERFFNTGAFRVPAQYTFGNAGRGNIDNPGTNNFDISIQKVFRILEGHTLQFRAELFNTFNHPLFNDPDINVDRANFGRITSARAARQVQFGLRYEF
ncbi:MAG: carboxypeptidase regulatory-like domain-containing protein [Bryobacteraceae bacterium]